MPTPVNFIPCIEAYFDEADSSIINGTKIRASIGGVSQDIWAQKTSGVWVATQTRLSTTYVVPIDNCLPAHTSGVTYNGHGQDFHWDSEQSKFKCGAAN